MAEEQLRLELDKALKEIDVKKIVDPILGEIEKAFLKGLDIGMKITPVNGSITSDEAVMRCWKCGKELTNENRANIVYTSYPLKYVCKDCYSRPL